MLLIALTVIAIGHRYIYIYLYYDIIYLCAYIVILNTFFFLWNTEKEKAFFWMDVIVLHLCLLSNYLQEANMIFFFGFYSLAV